VIKTRRPNLRSIFCPESLNECLFTNLLKSEVARLFRFVKKEYKYSLLHEKRELSSEAKSNELHKFYMRLLKLSKYKEKC
jgi:hypothetical protein